MLSPDSLSYASNQIKISVLREGGEYKMELRVVERTGPGVKGLELCSEKGKLTRPQLPSSGKLRGDTR